MSVWPCTKGFDAEVHPHSSDKYASYSEVWETLQITSIWAVWPISFFLGDLSSSSALPNILGSSNSIDLKAHL